MLAKECIAKVVNMLPPFALNGEVIVINNRGHLKIKAKYPSGNLSFAMGTAPSDNRWKHRAKTALKHFICTEILSLSTA